MKSILLASVLMLSASASLAQSSNYDDYFVQVLTWCEGDKVMSDKEDGSTYVYRDCAAKGQVCSTFQIQKRDSTIFAAACK